MHYNNLETGHRSPASLKRKNGSRYLWKNDGITYIQNGPDFKSAWVAEEPVLFIENEEIDTGEKWVNGETIYRKLLVGPSFTVGGSYGRIAHNIDDIGYVVSASGYVGDPEQYQYTTYANYTNLTEFRFYWTGSGAYEYHVWITYTKR